MPSFSYKSGNAKLDELRELLNDNDHSRVTFSDELLQSFLDKAQNVYRAASLAYVWLAGTPQALRVKFGLSQGSNNNDVQQAQDRALALAERFEAQAEMGLTTLEESFDPGAYLNELEQGRLR